MGSCKYLHMMCYQQRETILAKTKKNKTHLRTWPNFFYANQEQSTSLFLLLLLFFFYYVQSLSSLICWRDFSHCLLYIINYCEIFKMRLESNTTHLNSKPIWQLSYFCPQNLTGNCFRSYHIIQSLLLVSLSKSEQCQKLELILTEIKL